MLAFALTREVRAGHISASAAHGPSTENSGQQIVLGAGKRPRGELHVPTSLAFLCPKSGNRTGSEMHSGPGKTVRLGKRRDSTTR